MNRFHSIMSSTAWVAAIVALSWTVPALGDDYPSKPIRIVVTFTPGGAGDLLARIIGPKLNERLGQPAIVDNKPGAGGNIGADIVAHAKPDGYTLLIGYEGTLAINPSLYQQMPFDSIRDFAPVTNLVAQPILLAANPSLPVNTIPELIAYAKQHPGMLSYGSVGVGSVQHLSGELFRSMAGIDIVHIPYKGAAPGLTDLIAGNVKLMFVGLAAALPHVRSGQIKALAVVTAKRTGVLPDTPTIGETLPGYAISAWNGLVAPASTPPAVVEKLNAALVEIMHTPEVQKKLSALGFEVLADGPAEFAEEIRQSRAKWSKVVEASGARPD